MKLKNKKYSGFSFIEGILAVFLVSTGMVVVLSLISSSLKESMNSRDQIIASLLAQEGTELVRNLRDNNWAQGLPAFSDLCDLSGGSPSCSHGNYIIDKDSSVIKYSANKKLNIDSNGYYVTSSGTATKFQRRIVVLYYLGESNTAAISAIIRSVVVWGPNGFNLINLNTLSSTCNSTTKCAFAETVLTRWGGN
ncbi:MAG TPA: hypothetical protein P5232_01470 [Candidatus Moranbacteria bacterium]|nr:hypothetical protein [Candidatus Moranbacteria bacterium]